MGVMGEMEGIRSLNKDSPRDVVYVVSLAAFPRREMGAGLVV
jgi:hypothetical protein